MRCPWPLFWVLLARLFASPGPIIAADRLPTAQEMADSLTDVWGEAAIRQPGGPSYEFFKDLLPPLRYANTAFRHYPIVLSAPSGVVKARDISNGSAVNARADKKPMWREIGVPVHFHVGDAAEPYGDDLERLDGPRYVDGFLPIVRSAYRVGATSYEQEVFASVKEPLAERGTVLVRFAVGGGSGTVRARIDMDKASHTDGAILDGKGQGIVLYGPGWTWNGTHKELQVALMPGQDAFLAVPTQALPSPMVRVTSERVGQERQACETTWRDLLDQGAKFEIPELVVQDAWRSLIVGNFLVASGDRMNYSAGNAYDHLYEGECGDATRSLLQYGFKSQARSMVGPLLDFNRQATRYHVAGHKLQLLAHYYWVTRDKDYLREKEPVWKGVIDFIINSRRTTNGLLPPDNYAGDIPQQVYSLNSNSNCWRGLRDMAAVLQDLGASDRAEQLRQEAKTFREAILAAVAKSERRDVQPPFIPNALFGIEQPYDNLTATRMGSYYDLMVPYTIGSEVFGAGAERETWMIDYLRQHGGIAMGMIRSMPHQGEFNNQPGVNVLYGLRYMLGLLRRDDREHALTGFYGQLAQGMTRETFIGGEGSRFLHGDRFGRSFYLPPNTASNATFLTVLRYLLIQDWDLDGDGAPETLRLLYAAPARWLRDGAVLNVGRAPTAFGNLSFRVESRLSRGEIDVSIDSPPRPPQKWSLRLPLPPGWKVTAAKVGDTSLPLALDGAIDLTRRKDSFTVRFQVAAAQP